MLTASLKASATSNGSTLENTSQEEAFLCFDISSIDKHMQNGFSKPEDNSYPDSSTPSSSVMVDKGVLLKAVQTVWKEQAEKISQQIGNKSSSSHVETIQELQLQIQKTEQENILKIRLLEDQIKEWKEKTNAKQTSLQQLEEAKQKEIAELQEKNKAALHKKVGQLIDCYSIHHNFLEKKIIHCKCCIEKKGTKKFLFQIKLIHLLDRRGHKVRG